MEKKPDQDEQAPDESNLSAFQIRERKQRTCFVGNLPLTATPKLLKSLFREHGKVEKVWFRSLPTTTDSKLPVKAQIIKKEFVEQKDNKNAYVLFETKEAADQAAKALNQREVDGKHIRVDLSLKEGAKEKESGTSSNDYDTTIFIGNLPFVVSEEDLRRHFSDIAGKMTQGGEGLANDGILNVRIIRDKETHLSKGIAYV